MLNPKAQESIVASILADEEEAARSNLDYLQSCMDWPEAAEMVRLIINNFDAFQRALLTSVYETHFKPEHGRAVRRFSYNVPYTLKEALDFIPFFVSHEIHDDGSPTFVYAINPEMPSERPKSKTPGEWLINNIGRHAQWVPASEPGDRRICGVFILSNMPEWEGLGWAGKPLVSIEDLKIVIEHNKAWRGDDPPSDLQQALMALLAEDEAAT